MLACQIAFTPLGGVVYNLRTQNLDFVAPIKEQAGMTFARVKVGQTRPN